MDHVFVREATENKEEMRMNRSGKLAASLVVSAIAFAWFASPASAGSYNCKADRKLDVPMQFTPLVDGDGRVHVSAFGGSDKSRYVAPSAWRVYNAANAQIDYFPKGMVVFVSMDMFKETNIDGLQPGGTYTIELDSVDFCNNVGVVKKSITMPSGTRESTPPVLSTPALVQVGLQSFVTELQFSVTDDSGVQQVSVFVNGAMIASYTYDNGVSLRWWTDYYPYDNTLSTLEGPNYYVAYPDAYRGHSAQVDVVVTDVYGNQSTKSALLNL
jgi:hypothetical protein